MANGLSWDHTLAAARQGWCISQVDHEGHAPWEVQRLDDAEGVDRDWGISVPQLADDDAAVAAMKAAFDRGEPHAVAAYAFLLANSEEEFEQWGMQHWCCSG